MTTAINTPPVGIAFDLDKALFVRIRDVNVWYFDVGVSFNFGVAATYSAYHVLERFEINSCATGIRAGAASNGITLQNGRVWSSLVQYNAADPGGAREVGTGISLTGSLGATGPTGPTGFEISQVVVEGATTCVRVVAASDIAIIGCYFEPGDTGAGFGTVRRRILDVDAVSERLHVVGCKTSEPNNPGNELTWTPTYAAMVPEARTALEQDSFPGSGSSFTVNAYGGALHGATSAYSNRIKNGDMSRGTLFWPTANLGVGSSQVVNTNYLIGGQSLRLTVGNDSLFHMYQDFVLNSGVRSVSVGFRYRLLTAGANAFRVDLWDVASSTRLGFFSDTSSGGGSSAWQTRTLTGRFDGLAGGVQGPRTLRVRIYPYNASSPPPPAGQQVVVDAVWLVDGEYASPFRPYTEGYELLRGDDRETFFTGTNATVPIGPVSILPTRVPANAIGMVVEMRIQASNAAGTFTILRVDDNEGAVAEQTRDLLALANDRYSMTEYTVPITPGGTLPQWSMIGATATNLVTYRVRLKAWIVRM